MQIVTPVLNLAGNCEEAIHFYESAFDIKADLILHYSDAAKEDWKLPLTDIQKRYVYHAEMHIGKQRLMFSDIIEFELHKGNCVFLTISFDNKEEVQDVYKKMKAGSTVITEMKSTTYSSCCVNFTDKFGVRWGLMTEQPDR